ncbi:hypothetical protein LTS18_004271 [Coniosporium uncinatum]|uniref:Uncharacterized protein n=1 Tax=Coniosporium uncinatum TaxID=93489 RepID=A0ACC3E023_9PEZI|nr:hypothetical protein LTS18_004271 [Coniosporium uncinatum]
MADTYAKWKLLLQRCLQNRFDTQQFRQLASEMFKRFPAPGRQIADILLDQQSRVSRTPDILILVYVESLFTLGYVKVDDVLRALYTRSRNRIQQQAGDDGNDKQPVREWHNPTETEAMILEHFTRYFTTGKRPKTQAEVKGTLWIVSQWMLGLVASASNDAMDQALTTAFSFQSTRVRDALGTFSIALMENTKVEGVVNTAIPKTLRTDLSKALSSFIALWTQNDPHNAQRLELCQKSYGLIEETEHPVDQDDSLDVAALQVDTVIDLPIINTRAGVYVFLNALLVARPLTDETMIFSYMNMRYNGNIQPLAVDLIIAAFDSLSNAMTRTESMQTMFSLQSFLMNKVPVLLTMLSGSMFAPLTSEYCIGEALTHINPAAFPSLGDTFGMPSMISDVRQEFLAACVRHQLLPAASVERLLGERFVVPPPASNSRYSKDGLVAQCSGHPERAEELIGELEKLDGNGGAIVGAITENIRSMCATKETMSLKTVCIALTRRPQYLDVFLQFTSLVSILQPLCQLLDTWHYEEDQNEYQPVYDEFSAVLLLVQTFVNRYKLSHQDLGISADSFVANLMTRDHVSFQADQLSDEQRKQASGWIKGLLDPEAIIDEAMAHCPPQQFYFLVPTLFNQIILACSEAVITPDVLKNGLDWFLQSFLLPSVIGATSWMADAAQQGIYKHSVLVQVLNKLTTSPATSGDTQAMHSTVLAIVTRRIDRCLRAIQQKDPGNQKINPILERLKQHDGFERTPLPNETELGLWTKPPNSLTQSLHTIIQSLVLWSSAPAMSMAPPSYTHKQLHISLQLVGAQKVLRAIVDEVKAQCGAGQGSLALDVATALICAPSAEDSPVAVDWQHCIAPQPQPPRRSTNLREMLKVEFEGAKELVKDDLLAAETIVRLHRRVEAQLAVSNQLPIAMPDLTAINNDGMGDLMQDLDVSATGDAAAAAAADAMNQQQTIDFGNDSGGMDLGGGNTDTMDLGADLGLGDGTMSTEDDIFGDLDMDMGADLEF